MRRLIGAFAAGLAIVCLTSSAGAAPAASDIALNVGADQSNTRPTLIPNGGTATITSRNFYVFLDISLDFARREQRHGSRRARWRAALGRGRPGPDREVHEHADDR